MNNFIYLSYLLLSCCYKTFIDVIHKIIYYYNNAFFY